jgi:serine/threonine protein kinase
MDMRQYQQIGPYQLQRFLGRGRTSEVWNALDCDSRKHVALKIETDSSIVRASREAQILTQVYGQSGHPNIVELEHYSQGDHYVALTLFEGRSVREMLNEHGRLSSSESLRLIVQSAQAVSYAATQGVYHSDLKPEHLVVSSTGSLKLVDWGSAIMQLRGNSLEQTLASQDYRFHGTLPYMAPEQREGEAITEKTLSYQLGVILHEMLTGKRAKAVDEVGTRGQTQGIKDSVFNFIRQRMLPSNPADRLAPYAIADSLHSLFLAGTSHQKTESGRLVMHVTVDDNALGPQSNSDFKEAYAKAVQDSVASKNPQPSRSISVKAAALFAGIVGLSSLPAETNSVQLTPPGILSSIDVAVDPTDIPEVYLTPDGTPMRSSPFSPTDPQRKEWGQYVIEKGIREEDALLDAIVLRPHPILQADRKCLSRKKKVKKKRR